MIGILNFWILWKSVDILSIIQVDISKISLIYEIIKKEFLIAADFSFYKSTGVF